MEWVLAAILVALWLFAFFAPIAGDAIRLVLMLASTFLLMVLFVGRRPSRDP